MDIKIIGLTGPSGAGKSEFCRALKNRIVPFIDADKVWPYQNNEQWNLHSSDQNNRDHRTMLMHNQVKQLFGAVPTDMEDYITASQLSQAEAKKYFVEKMRCRMARNGGVIWWNLIDGWPQFSDAIVDYYGVKKLAYHYVKRSQNPLCLMIDEPRDGMLSLYAVNEESSWGELSFKVTDLTDKKLLVSGTASYLGRASEKIADFEEIDGAHYLFIEWECGGRKYTNHYITNIKNLNYEEYLKFIDSVGYSAFEGF